MKYTPEQIWDEDGGIVTLGNDHLRGVMARALALVPAEAADRILVGCLLVSTSDDPNEFASVIPADLAEGKALIVFSSPFFKLGPGDQDEIMLHECAHVLLGHRSAALELDADAYARHEHEAWDQVADWLDQAPRMMPTEPREPEAPTDI